MRARHKIQNSSHSFFRKAALYGAAAAVYIIASLVLFEFFIELLLRNPSILTEFPDRFLANIRDVYAREDRFTINGDLVTAQYDPELFYTLRPGKFIFENREFKTHYEVNHLGIRDDEQSLIDPEIIVLGDSIAMGWGVEQDETFAKVLQKITHKKVLNTAVSSYGTVREKLMLDRVKPNLKKLKTIVIQYHSNDLEENAQFYSEGNHLSIHSKDDFEYSGRRHAKWRKYYPLKYFFQFFAHDFFEKYIRTDFPGITLGSAAPTGKDAAQLFLNAFINSGKTDLSNVRIIFLHINGHNMNHTMLLTRLQALLNDKSLPKHVKNMTLIDVSSFLGPEHYYILDDHLNKSGHDLVARAIANFM